MTDTAINSEGLGKQYFISEASVPYKTFRESITNVFAAPLRRIKGRRNKSVSHNAIWALKNFSFEVKHGQVVGIIGRNGAGKSTLLKILSRVTKPTVGRVKIYGRVGSLLEVGTGFHPELTGRENIYLNGAILGMKRVEIRRKFEEIVAFAEIEKFLDTPVKRYSSGMYVRLAFAVAAHLEPEILLVDEVLAVGDVEFQKKCLGKMRDVADGGRTVLFVSHNLPVVQRLCNHGCLLDQGDLITSGKVDAVIDAYYELVGTAADDQTLDLRNVPSGAVRYVSWKLKTSGSLPDHNCITQEECVFDFQLIVKRTISKANFGLLIFDKEGNWILGIRRGVNAEECVRLTNGIYRVQFTVPTLSIKPGQYAVQAIVGDRYEGNIDEWYAQPRLTVLPKPQSSVTDGWYGLLNIDGSVNVTRVEQ